MRIASNSGWRSLEKFLITHRGFPRIATVTTVDIRAKVYYVLIRVDPSDGAVDPISANKNGRTISGYSGSGVGGGGHAPNGGEDVRRNAAS